MPPAPHRSTEIPTCPWLRCCLCSEAGLAPVWMSRPVACTAPRHWSRRPMLQVCTARLSIMPVHILPARLGQGLLRARGCVFRFTELPDPTAVSGAARQGLGPRVHRPAPEVPPSPASRASGGVITSLLCVRPLCSPHIPPRPGSATNLSSLLRVPVLPGAAPLCRRRLQRVFTRPC